MNNVLDKVEAAIEKAEPVVVDAVRKTLGEDAAKKVNAATDKLQEALHDPVSAIPAVTESRKGRDEGGFAKGKGR